MSFLKKLLDNQSAVISIEASVLLPLLLLTTFGGYDLISYINISDTIDRTSAITADLTSQGSVVCMDQSGGLGKFDIGQSFNAAYETSKPLDIVKNGKIIITSLTDTGTAASPNPIIAWTVSEVPTNSSQSSGNNPAYGLTDASHIISNNVPPTPILPGGFVLNPGENIIAVEVFYNYQPIFLGAGIIFKNVLPEIYRVSFYRPRQGDLSVLLPNTDPRCM